MFKFFNKYYYKANIIITLSLVTAALLIAISRIGYYFVENLYLEQLKEKVIITSRMLSNQIDVKYFFLLDLGVPSTTANEYFDNIINKNMSDELHAQVSIFNLDFQSLVDTDSLLYNPELPLYGSEINSLNVGKTITTIPFEGADDNWYLYGFYRFDENHFLGIKVHAKRFERVRNINTLFWVIGLGGTVLIGIISWLLASSVTKPLYKLVEFSKKIGDNNYDVSVPTNIKGEIKILAHALDTMRYNISENHKERENMLAQIAHEIRNPLGGIELLAELTKEDLQKNNLTTEYQDKILNEIYRLKSLIAAYLNYSKPMPANPSEVEIAILVDEIKSIAHNKLEAKNITLAIEVDCQSIHFDKDQLRHILLNLVTNSIDAVEQNGEIKIISKRQNGWCKISVIDNGKGLFENPQKIFEPFFTTRNEGTGLGLAICKKFCSENNAEITAINNNDGGATFTLKKRDI